ncbi:MAG: DNA-directed RNA polymerase subunit K [Thermoprotei archaeon]|nr:MAG: DNA-directed RNA polymerase subunit K [Thermoprotei archaeon]
MSTKFIIRIGPPWLTKYEKARIIGARALQLSLGAPPLLPVEEMGLKDPIEIASLELRHKLLPMVIRRWTPGGDYQDIPLKYLEIR